MSTQSAIGAEREDGSILAVFCHYDGYPSGVGAMLDEHYRDRRKLDALLALGPVWALDRDIGERHPPRERRNGWTTFHGRDGGATTAAPDTFAGRADWLDAIRRTGTEYVYLFTAAGDWLAAKRWGRWRPLADVLARGVEVLREPDPDRGPDVVIKSSADSPSGYLLSGYSRTGREWLESRIPHLPGELETIAVPGTGPGRTKLASVDGVDALAEIRSLLECAHRDGVFVEHDRQGGGA